MKRLICLILALIVLSACSVQPEPVRYSFTEVVDTSYTPPDTYEVCYRTTFSNGLIVDHWEMVTKEEYEEVNRGY